MEFDIDLDAIEVRRIFDYDRRLLPNSYLAEVDSQCHDLRQAIMTSGLSVGYPAWNLLYYCLLCALPRDLSSPNVVETGTNLGYSTIVMAQVLKDRQLGCKLQTVDINPQITDIARSNIERAGLSEHVDFHSEDSLQFLQRYLANLDTVHFAFLDGNHEKEHVVKEFKILHPYLKPKLSTVYFDNTTKDGVAEAIQAITAEFGGNLVEFPNCSWGPPGNAVWQP